MKRLLGSSRELNEEAEFVGNVMDEVTGMITAASMMAAKVVAANIDAAVQSTEETLKEMGDQHGKASIKNTR